MDAYAAPRVLPHRWVEMEGCEDGGEPLICFVCVSECACVCVRACVCVCVRACVCVSE